MIKRTVATGAVLLTMAAVAGCSSSSKAKSKASSTTAASSSTTTVAATSTTAGATTTTAPMSPATTSTPGGTSAAPTDAEGANKQFFLAWTAHDSAELNVTGTTTAANEAIAQYSKTSGPAWQFSNCQGAAGSIYCTWVRAAEAVVLRASNVSPANRVVNFQWNALDAAGISAQLVDAWQFASTGALQALATSGAYAQLQALQSHSHDGWQAPTSCDGTAGSFYCTYTAGAHKLVIQVGDVQTPHQVIGVTYS